MPRVRLRRSTVAPPMAESADRPVWHRRPPPSSLGPDAARRCSGHGRPGAASTQLPDSPAIVVEQRRTCSLAGAVGTLNEARLEDNGATLTTVVRIDRHSLFNGLFYGIDGMRVGGTRRFGDRTASGLRRSRRARRDPRGGSADRRNHDPGTTKPRISRRT